MDWVTYKTEALKTNKVLHLPDADQKHYYLCGLFSEVGEAMAVYKRSIRDQEKMDHMVAELGDICWYLAMLQRSFGRDDMDHVAKPEGDIWDLLVAMSSKSAKLLEAYQSLVRAAASGNRGGIIAHKVTMKVTIREILEIVRAASYYWAEGGLGDILQWNIDKLTDRENRGVIHGKGDFR